MFADFCSNEGVIRLIDYDSSTLEEKRMEQEKEASSWYTEIISARAIQSNDLLLKENQMLRDDIIKRIFSKVLTGS